MLYFLLFYSYVNHANLFLLFMLNWCKCPQIYSLFKNRVVYTP